MCSVTVSYASPVQFEKLGFILSFVQYKRLKRKWSFSEFPMLVLSYGDPRRVWLYPVHLDLEAIEYSGGEQELWNKNSLASASVFAPVWPWAHNLPSLTISFFLCKYSCKY